jgi:pterin-4a-carbinolamine dehydratase
MWQVMSVKSKKINWKEAETRLTKKEITALINQLQNWYLKGTTIEKNFKFDTFEQAINFINKVASLASIENHHPDIMFCGISIM